MKANSVGIDLEREGTYIQEDQEALVKVSEMLERSGIVLRPIYQALQEFPWVKKYLWRILDREKDEYTEITPDNAGYFIYARRGARSPFPVQACLYIKKEEVQTAHNIIVVEEGAHLDVITGCLALTDESLHVGVTEMFVKGTLNYFMIHNWGKNEARPRTGALVEGTLNSIYVNLYEAKLVQSNPYYVVRGGNLTSASILYGKGDTKLDIGSTAVVEGGKALLISRSIADDKSKILSPLKIIGKQGSKGHIDCKTLVLSEEAKTETIPSLVSESEDVELSHEAYVGRLDRRKVEYLMTKGLNEEEATELLVRGFTRLDLPLPPALKIQLEQVSATISKLAKG